MSEAPQGRNRWLRVAGGWILLGAGIAGCILPVIPGIPLLLAGLLILSRDYAWARSLLGKAKRKAVAMRRKARGRPPARPVANTSAD